MLRIVLGTLLLVGGGFLGWISLSGDSVKPAAASAVVMAKILVAAEPLQAGTLLKDTDVKEKEVPSTEVEATDFPADENTHAEIRGAMLRRYLDAGKPIQRADILRPRDRGFLASVLAPGTRAISIGVDATTGASGLISPGDLVDVILTQEFARGETTAGRRVVAEAVLSRVRVIAVDQQIAQGAPTSAMQTVTPSPRVASNVSLQVTPDQAARVVVASRLGRLTLVVRSIDGDTGGDTASADNTAHGGEHGATKAATVAPQASVFGSDVSTALSDEAPATSPKMRVIQGDSVNDLVFH